MTKRKLLDKEIEITTKALVVKKEELAHLILMEQHNTFMVEKMLESNFKEKMRQFKSNGIDLKDEIKVLTNVIDISEDQIKNGVEVKEIVEVKKTSMCD